MGNVDSEIIVPLYKSKPLTPSVSVAYYSTLVELILDLFNYTYVPSNPVVTVFKQHKYGFNNKITS